MTELQLRSLLREKPILACFVKQARPEVLAVYRQSGVDAAILDLEHATTSERDAHDLLVAAHTVDLPVIVRVDGLHRGLINRLLESGAAGIQIPRLVEAAQVEALVEYSTYPPSGTRSVSTTHLSAGYGEKGLLELLNSPKPLLVGQIETTAVRESLWAGLARLDVAFVGTTDLSVSAGSPGDLKPVSSLLQQLEEACVSSDVDLGAFVSNSASASGFLRRGYRYIAWGSDVDALRSGVEARTREFTQLLQLEAEQ